MAPEPRAPPAAPAVRRVAPGPRSGAPVASSSSPVRSLHCRYPPVQKIHVAVHHPCRDRDPALGSHSGPGLAADSGLDSGPGPGDHRLRGWRRHDDGVRRAVNATDDHRAHRVRPHCVLAPLPRPGAPPDRAAARRALALHRAGHRWPAPRGAAVRCAAVRGSHRRARDRHAENRCVYPHGVRRSDRRRVHGRCRCRCRCGDANFDHGRRDYRDPRGAARCGCCAGPGNPGLLPRLIRRRQRNASGWPRNPRRKRRGVRRCAPARWVHVRARRQAGQPSAA